MRDIKCKITSSSGGGVAGYNSANNRVHHCDINLVHDNGIFFANLGSDNNMIEWNIVDGTTSQNGIFITASSRVRVNFVFISTSTRVDYINKHVLHQVQNPQIRYMVSENPDLDTDTWHRGSQIYSKSSIRMLTGSAPEISSSPISLIAEV